MLKSVPASERASIAPEEDLLPRPSETIAVPGLKRTDREAIVNFDRRERYGYVRPRHSRPLKRLLDITVAVLGMIAVSPLFIALWSAIRLTSRGPGIYWSQRLGWNGIAFWMPKLRSMAQDAPVLPREQFGDAHSHITWIGRLIRASSLDEMPQLWSVLRGDMSLVGPRPLIPSDPGISARWDFPDSMDVRPGLTGLAQVRGRNLVSPRMKARYDAFYAKKSSWSFDFRIAWQTLLIVASRRGVI